jgi:hypothetical protein
MTVKSLWYRAKKSLKSDSGGDYPPLRAYSHEGKE